MREVRGDQYSRCWIRLGRSEVSERCVTGWDPKMPSIVEVAVVLHIRP